MKKKKRKKTAGQKIFEENEKRKQENLNNKYKNKTISWAQYYLKNQKKCVNAGIQFMFRLSEEKKKKMPKENEYNTMNEKNILIRNYLTILFKEYSDYDQIIIRYLECFCSELTIMNSIMNIIAILILLEGKNISIKDF